MAVIKKDFGFADSAGHASGGKPELASAMRDVADDLAAIQPTTAASADATDLPTVLTLANELKAI